MFARIAGVGSFLPGSPVSNNDLAQRGLDTSDEWIATRTGIRSRHLADPNLTSSELLSRPVCERWKRLGPMLLKSI